MLILATATTLQKRTLMNHNIRSKPTLLLCLILCLAWYIPAQANPQPVPVLISEPSIPHYTFETISVPGVDFLALSASSDFGDYAGFTRSADNGKEIAFTLIDDVFTTYDFPNSQKTHFFALGNNGVAAGHYKGTDGLYHGVVLDENGELKQYDFPGAVQTFIFGISDETGALSGNIVDTDGVYHAFSGELKITFPGAVATYGDFVNATGTVVGSYIDADGMFHGFIRNPDGSFTTIDLPEMPNLQYLFVNTITDAGVIGFRAKAVNDILRSYILLPSGSLHEVRLPGSVITVVRNVNQDGSIVGYYDTADGRVHGFVGIPVDKAVSDHFGNYYNVTLTKGLNMLSLPLASPKPMTAKSLAGLAGSTMVIALDAENQRFIGWTPNAPDDGFAIEGGQGYIVNVPKTRNFAFVGAPWTDTTEETAAAPPAVSEATSKETWAFVVSGHLKGNSTHDGYNVIVRNLRTNTVITAQVRENYFAAGTVNLNYQSVVQVGDTVEVTITDSHGYTVSENYRFQVTPTNLTNAFLSINLDNIGVPKHSQLLQNYPNPFNPETWIPYRLSEDSNVSITIYDSTGSIIRNLSLGFQSVGFYQDRGRAAYWNGKNASGEGVASGLYFYQLTTKSFQQTRRLIVVK